MTDTMGRMHSDAQLTLFSSFSLGKTNKFPLHSLVRRFAGSSSVKPKAFPPSRSAKQTSLLCTHSRVGSSTRGDDMQMSPQYIWRCRLLNQLMPVQSRGTIHE